MTGRNTPDNVIAYLRDIGAECRARGCDRVLIEEQLEGPRLDLRAVLKVVHDPSVAAGMPTIAYVDLNAQGPQMASAADLAALRGMKVALFSSVDAARQWLASERNVGRSSQ